MSELSIDLDAFLALPIIVKRRILSFLSPWDLLNVAECHQALHSLVAGLPKRAKSISTKIRSLEYPRDWERRLRVTLFKTVIDGWNGSRRRYVREIGWWPSDECLRDCPQQIFIEQANEYNSRLIVTEFGVGQERQKREVEILLRNGTFQKVEDLSVGMLNWGIRATSISIRPTWEDTEVRKTIDLIEKTKATQVALLDGLKSESDVAELFTNEAIRSLSSIEVKLEYASFLPHLSSIRASRLIVEFGIRLDQADAETVALFVRRMIEEWLTGTRDIEEVEFDLPAYSFEDYTQEAEFADRLTKGFDGKNEMASRVHLIRRKTEALGLLVWCRNQTVRIRSCNYEIRRSRGLGAGNVMYSLLDGIRRKIIQRCKKPVVIRPQEHETKLLRMIDMWREHTRNIPDREIDLDLELFFIGFGRKWDRSGFASRLRIREYIREFESTNILPAAADYSD